MKILVFGDSHGEINNIEKYLDEHKVDMIMHTGDFSNDGVKVATKYNIPLYTVKGNCDIKSTSEYEISFEINDVIFFVTHGHQYNVKQTLQNIYFKGLELNAKIIIFGHTHIPLIEKLNDVIIINPGSSSKPRGFSSPTAIELSFAMNEFKADMIYL